MKDEKSLTRRSFIQRISFLGVLGVGGGTLLSACGGGTEKAAEPEVAPQPQAQPPSGEMAEFSCNDVSGLTDQELATRQSVQYVDASPDPAKICTGCALWQAVPEGQQCGSCLVVKGPIHPKGYCTSWVPKPEQTS